MADIDTERKEVGLEETSCYFSHQLQHFLNITSFLWIKSYVICDFRYWFRNRGTHRFPAKNWFSQGFSGTYFKYDPISCVLIVRYISRYYCEYRFTGCYCVNYIFCWIFSLSSKAS